jgi:hypothetical protein
MLCPAIPQWEQATMFSFELTAHDGHHDIHARATTDGALFSCGFLAVGRLGRACDVKAVLAAEACAAVVCLDCLEGADRRQVVVEFFGFGALAEAQGVGKVKVSVPLRTKSGQ